MRCHNFVFISALLLVTVGVVPCTLCFEVIPLDTYVTSGYNALNGKWTLQQILSDFTFDQNKTITLYDYNNGGQSTTVYAVPDQIHAIYSPMFGVEADTFRSTEAYINKTSWDFGIGVQTYYHNFKALGLSTGVENMTDQISESGSTYFLSKQYVDLYTLQFLPISQMQSISTSFKNAVSSLPSKFDQQNQTSMNAFGSFMSTYGSHIAIEVTAGGMMVVDGYATEQEKAMFSDYNVQIQASLSFISHTFDTANLPFAGVDKNSQSTSMKSLQVECSWYGGLGTPCNSDYEGWISTLQGNPYPTRYRLQEIIPYIEMIDQNKAQPYIDYINYLNQAVQANAVSSEGPIIMGWGVGSSPSTSHPFTEVSRLQHTDYVNGGSGLWIASSNAQNIYRYGYTPAVNWGQTIFSSMVYSGQKDNDMEMHEDTRMAKRYNMPRISFPRNGYCGLYSCLPGLDVIGVGYDAVLGSSRLQVMDWTYTEEKTVSINGEVFSVPDQVNYFSNSTGSNTPTVKVFSSAMDYASSQASDSGISAGHNIFFQMSRETSYTYSMFEGAQSILVLAEQRYPMFTLSLKYANGSLSFIDAIKNLPEEYDPIVYQQFIQFYGTHVVTMGEYGGKATLFSAVDQNYFLTNTQSSLESGAKIHFDDFTVGFQYGVNNSDTSASFAKESFGSMWFYGGSANVLTSIDTSDWNSWVKSTLDSPTQISRKLLPLSEFTYSSKIAQNLERAVEEYALKATLETENTFQNKVDMDMMLASLEFTQSSPTGYPVYGGSSTCLDHEDFCNTVDCMYNHNQMYASKFYYNAGADYYNPPIVASLNLEPVYASFNSYNYATCPVNTWITTYFSQYWSYNTAFCSDVSSYGVAYTSSSVECNYIGYYPSAGSFPESHVLPIALPSPSPSASASVSPSILMSKNRKA